MPSQPLTLYGADACPDTARARSRLDYLGVPYLYVPVDEDRAALTVAASLAGGKPQLPMVVIDGTRLVEPTLGELDHALRENGWLA